MSRKLTLFAALAAVLCAALIVPVLAQKSTPEAAKPAGADHPYKIGEIEFNGYIAMPENAGDKKFPAVLVVHDWMGEKKFEHDKCDELAKLGYVAFACDMYGKGVRPKNAAEARAEAGKVYGDPKLLRERVNAAFDTLKQLKNVEPTKVCAMGFCFGGKCVLELARSGADAAAVISFHGSLDTKSPAKDGDLKAKVLVLHGADDPGVPQESVTALMNEMRQAKADWQLVQFGNSVHSFTNPAAGTDNSKGAAFNEKANARSWEMLKDFLAEVTK